MAKWHTWKWRDRKWNVEENIATIFVSSLTWKINHVRDNNFLSLARILIESIKYVQNWSSEFGINLFLLRWYYSVDFVLLSIKIFRIYHLSWREKSKKYKELSEKKIHKTIFKLFFPLVFFWWFFVMIYYFLDSAPQDKHLI